MKVVRIILMIINAVAALGLILTTLAGSVAPSNMILPSLMAYAFVSMLALNVVFTLMWLLMKRWAFLISAAAIAVRWPIVCMYLQVGGDTQVPDRAVHEQMLSLMTYNVHQFRGPGLDYNPSDSIAREFLNLVRREQPDVLCMQEYAAVKKVNITDSLSVQGYNHYYGSHAARSGVPYGTVVFSRMPITYVNAIDGEKLLVELMHPSGKRLRVLCLHMDSYRFDDADREEIERMRHGDVDSTSGRTIAKVRETIVRHQDEWEQHVAPVVAESSLPLVVAGDLNDIPSSWLYSRLTDNLHDTFRERGRGVSITYNGGFPRYRIDAVFRSDGLRTLSYKRLRSDISDHYPVLVALEFEP